MKKLAALLIIAVLLAGFDASWAGQTPTADLKFSIDQVVELLANKRIPRKERYDKVVGKIYERFDFVTMCKVVLGRKWNTTPEEQRKVFIDRFTHILEYTFMGRIEAYTDEKVRYTGEAMKDGKAKVDTVLISKSGEIPIEFRMHNTGDQWMVYDVSIEGVSLVRNFQDTYSSYIRKEGIDGLLDKMAEKVEELKVKSEQK